MNEIAEQYNKNRDLHHFYLLEGDKNVLDIEITDFLEKQLQIDTADKSIFYSYQFNSFFVKDSREILSKSQIKTPIGKKMVFVVYINSITPEAQNALLKLLEEPSERTYFFIVLPSINNLLPTFTSRAVVVRSSEKRAENILEQFRKMSVGERIKFVEGLVKEIKDEKKEKIEAQNFVRDLIDGFEKEILENPQDSLVQARKDSLRTLLKIEDYLKDSGASTKILLERAVLLI